MRQHIRAKYFAKPASANIGIGATVSLITINIPANVVLRLKEFANNLGTLGAWGLVTWRFVHNGRPLPPYDAILDPMGFGSQREPVEELELTAGTFEIIATNASAAICAVSINIAYEELYKE